MDFSKIQSQTSSNIDLYKKLFSSIAWNLQHTEKKVRHKL